MAWNISFYYITGNLDFLIEQLEKGVIPYRKVGTHRRVMFKDLMEYKQTMDHNRLKALDELSAIDQELGLGY